MNENKPKVSIGIVNYKTALMTKLCLRSLRRFTKAPYEVIVVDNNSGDDSLEYLRSVKWIKLIERKDKNKISNSWMHGSALNLALEAATSDYFVSLHNDTIMYRDGWLDELMKPVLANPEVVCTGCGKIDLKPQWLMLLKACTDVKKWLRELRPGKRRDFYVRTICALYKIETLKKEGWNFTTDVEEHGMTCGQQLYYNLLDKGYPVAAISEWTMAAYLHHLAHATMVFNPEGEFKVRSRTDRKCRDAVKRVLDDPLTQSILADDSLDN